MTKARSAKVKCQPKMKDELPPGGLRLDCGGAGSEELPKEMLLPPPGGCFTAMLARGAATSMA